MITIAPLVIITGIADDRTPYDINAAHPKIFTILSFLISFIRKEVNTKNEAI